MSVPSPKVPSRKAPTISNLSSIQLTLLDEIINRVSNAVESTTREFECLISWRLHRGEHKHREKCGFLNAKGEHSCKNLTSGGRRTQSQNRWDVRPWKPYHEESQKRQSYDEHSREYYYPHNCYNQPLPSPSYPGWSMHAEG